jgi:integrase
MAVKVRERRGAWWLIIDHKGRRKAKRVGAGKEGRRAALAAAEKVQAKLALGEAGLLGDTPTTEVVPLRRWGQKWLTALPLRCKPNTVERYRRELALYWLPSLGSKRLDDITREDVKRTLQKLREQGLKPNTLKQAVLPTLQSCLTAAVEDGLLKVSPAARLGRFIREDRLRQERIDPFAREELRLLVEVARRDFPEHYPMILTLARTGLRIGEALALRAEDLDFRERAILIRRNFSRGRLGVPKTSRGRRVDMSDQLAEVLQGHLTLRQAEAAVEGGPPSPWLFTGHDGRQVSYSWFIEHVWSPLLRRAGVRYRPPHQLRHTFASLLIQNRESLAYVRDQLGHASIRLTVDTYAHLQPGGNRQAVNRLDEATTRNLSATSNPLDLHHRAVESRPSAHIGA